jgi:putative YhbY family RNA-binding protein
MPHGFLGIEGPAQAGCSRFVSWHLLCLKVPPEGSFQTARNCRAGIDDGVVAAVEQALTDHELIKIKLGEAAAIDRHDAAEAIAQRTGSEVAQVLGNTLLLYRADPDDPGIVLP